MCACSELDRVSLIIWKVMCFTEAEIAKVGNYLHLKTVVVFPFPRFHLCEHTTIAVVSLKSENHQLLSLKSKISFSDILGELYRGPTPSHALVLFISLSFSAQE